MPYKDAERRRAYQRAYYRDRNIAHRRPHEPTEFVKSFKTKSIRFEEDDYQNLIQQMLYMHKGSTETFNFSDAARKILFDWAGEISVARRRDRLDPPAPAF